jgi:hypothetical protein
VAARSLLKRVVDFFKGPDDFAELRAHFANVPKKTLEFRFCGVFRYGKRLFLGYEEGVGGPRRLLLPPRELPSDIGDLALGEAVLAALESYRETGVGVSAPEWERLNRELLALFDAPSVAAFERKKRDVTIRQTLDATEIRLFGPRQEEVALTTPSPAELGAAIRALVRGR